LEVKHEGKYVYCVIGSGGGENLGNGLGGYPVYIIPYRDISAVVSDTPMVEYEPNEVNVLLHERVVENAMREHTVLPLGFGNIFINEDKVKWLLARFYPTLKTHLKRLENKVEVGVKVFYDIEATKQEVERTSREIKRLREREALKVAGERAYKYGVEIYETLKNCAEDTHLMKRIGSDMILNGAFLIHKDKIADFEGELEKVKRLYEGKGLKFQYSGPWPPYNFARIRIGR